MVSGQSDGLPKWTFAGPLPRAPPRFVPAPMRRAQECEKDLFSQLFT
jgi:hypothetical protein